MKILINFLLLFFYINVHAQKNEKHVRYGDRFYIYHILNDIFGPKSSEILQKDILSYPEVFGGSCSLMEEILIEDPNNENPKVISSEYTCRQGLAESKIAMFTRSALVRNSFVNKACSDLVSNPDLVNYASRDTLLLKNESDKINQLLQRFYPFLQNSSQLSEDILTKFKDNFLLDLSNENLIYGQFVIKNSNNTLLSSQIFIQNIIYMLCISEEWQIP